MDDQPYCGLGACLWLAVSVVSCGVGLFLLWVALAVATG